QRAFRNNGTPLLALERLSLWDAKFRSTEHLSKKERIRESSARHGLLPVRADGGIVSGLCAASRAQTRRHAGHLRSAGVCCRPRYDVARNSAESAYFVHFNGCSRARTN